MTTFGRDLVESLSEALDHAKGKKTDAREHGIEVPDVRAIREALHMSQTEFARAYRIPLPTLIARMPKETQAALRS
jgi:putative transcriptional regulator